MNSHKAMFIDGVISALILLMAYAFYVGQHQTFMIILYILAIYGFVHFIVDSYGFLMAPEKDKPRKFERKKLANDIPIPVQDIKMEEEVQ